MEMRSATGGVLRMLARLLDVAHVATERAKYGHCVNCGRTATLIPSGLCVCDECARRLGYAAIDRVLERAKLARLEKP